MKKRNAEKASKEHFNDLLLPITAVLCVLPFVVYLAEYDYGYSKYLWHSDNSLMQDFYTWYRAIFFVTAVFFAMVILLFRFALYRENIKRFHIFLPLAGYVVFAALSALFSMNPKASWLGNFVDFEGFFVLAGYVIIACYAYQIIEKERDYRSLSRAVRIMFLLISLVGWFQVFKHDLLNYEWVQRIVMPDELYAEYGGTIADLFTGNNVFLTLYNPNFAAIFLVMFACVFLVQFLGAKNHREKVCTAIFLLDALLLIWFTYTRAAVAALVPVFVVLYLYTKKQKKANVFRYLAAGIGLLFLLLLGVDFVSGGKYAGRVLDHKKDAGTETILTTETGVELTYNGVQYVLAIEESKALEADGGRSYRISLSDADGNTISMKQTQEGDSILPFSSDGRAAVIQWDGMPQILLRIDGHTLQFVKQDKAYYYYTGWGKTDTMIEIPKADFHGLEYLGSGRFYIWSRIIPMLKCYMLIGSGPETFAEVYPQNDYVGKMIYADNPGRIIERAHNDYLMRWVQTGFLSLICILLFYVFFLRRCWNYFQSCSLDTMRDKLGFGCFLGCIGYMVCSFFSDSTLYTTPVFYVFAGIALAAAGEETVCPEQKISC